jgi:hypothetical protein
MKSTKKQLSALLVEFMDFSDSETNYGLKRVGAGMLLQRFCYAKKLEAKEKNEFLEFLSLKGIM